MPARIINLNIANKNNFFEKSHVILVGIIKFGPNYKFNPKKIVYNHHNIILIYAVIIYGVHYYLLSPIFGFPKVVIIDRSDCTNYQLAS